MSEQEQIRYLPFHAINEFMLDEYREKVVRFVFENLGNLSSSRRNGILSIFKKQVKIPGFRDSSLAPLPLKIKQGIVLFQKNADFVAQVLQAWVELHHDLKERVHAMLVSRGWKNLLPPELDRSKLPGFQVEWPKSETYEVLDQSFYEQNPGVEAPNDDIRLMVVWLVNALPYELFEENSN
ncbi:hypothetical protein [Anaerolinea thermophila]|uniref:Uncharacterized protein n=1 Tax=Anaerolinea thermophila (strain DSM 14523 / JCM 11388 / NBRC 100420 / UNI-1) TaxID=926569 RepID=E8N553_ANATU|nr:hypothetical protein [Anaerolinea thermophila]BAJ63567.1 hypothetical protein ANT_15390 [Anaerolinea thermophila UNI-1]